MSDPDSSEYAQYLSLDEIVELFAPETHKVQELKNWLYQYHVEEKDISITPTRDFVTVKVPVAVANHMFDVSFVLEAKLMC